MTDFVARLHKEGRAHTIQLQSVADHVTLVAASAAMNQACLALIAKVPWPDCII